MKNPKKIILLSLLAIAALAAGVWLFNNTGLDENGLPKGKVSWEFISARGETGTRPINWGKVWYDAAMPRMARLAIGDTAWWDLTTLKARVGEQGGRSGSSYYATKI